MPIPFVKAHGARNDFLLTWTKDMPTLGAQQLDLPALARAICDRNTGIGADGWMLVDERPGIRLFNSDGSEPELSGNGTRCAVAFLMTQGFTGQKLLSDSLVIATGAGPKRLTLLARHENEFTFEMNMGRPRVLAARFDLPLATGPRDVTLLDCGNPQCAVPVNDFAFDWAGMGREIEAHPQFRHRTNVSFLRAVTDHRVEARFYERGAGVTMSSGTGSTGVAMCALVRGLAASPIRVETVAGPLDLIERGGEMFLQGPAVIVGTGVFFWPPGG